MYGEWLAGGQKMQDKTLDTTTLIVAAITTKVERA